MLMHSQSSTFICNLILSSWHKSDFLQTYPSEEIVWLATAAFNHAVDLFSLAQDEASQRWMEKALAVAKLASDNGNLHKRLEAKYLSFVSST
jgi:hypothetical protein